VAISSEGVVAVAAGKELRVIRSGDPSPGEKPLALAATANRLAFSADGQRLAACTASGDLRLWSLQGQQAPAPVALEDADRSGRSTMIAFSPDGRRLVSGDQDGGLRTWELPDGHQRPPIAARRGQVASLSVSGDGRYLLQVTPGPAGPGVGPQGRPRPFHPSTATGRPGSSRPTALAPT